MKHYYRGCVIAKNHINSRWLWWDTENPTERGEERTMGNCKVMIDWYRRKQSDERIKEDNENARLL